MLISLFLEKVNVIRILSNKVNSICYLNRDLRKTDYKLQSKTEIVLQFKFFEQWFNAGDLSDSDNQSCISGVFMRFIICCWAIERTLLVTQYIVSPDGKVKEKIVKIKGSICIIFTCVESIIAVWGVIFCWIYIDTPIKRGVIPRPSGCDKSLIQKMNGAWRSSTALESEL